MNKHDFTPEQILDLISTSACHELIRVATGKGCKRRASRRNAQYKALAQQGVITPISGSTTLTWQLTTLGAQVIAALPDTYMDTQHGLYPMPEDTQHAKRNATTDDLPEGEIVPGVAMQWRQKLADADADAAFVAAVVDVINRYNKAGDRSLGKLLDDARATAVNAVRAQATRATTDDRIAWLAKHNAITPEAYCDKYNLSRFEYKALEHLIERVRYTPREYYPVDVPPTPEQRQVARDNVTYSKKQACADLGISPGRFDNLKRELSIEHVKTYRAGAHVGYLYSGTAIDKMRAAATDDR